MNEKQIQNTLRLCYGEPVGKIMQLFKLGMLRDPQIRDLANHFGCNATREDVAFHLSIGR